jgi:hypothetical protein
MSSPNYKQIQKLKQEKRRPKTFYKKKLLKEEKELRISS